MAFVSSILVSIMVSILTMKLCIRKYKWKIFILIKIKRQSRRLKSDNLQNVLAIKNFGQLHYLIIQAKSCFQHQ